MVKLHPRLLRLFFERLGAVDPDVVLGPALGEDAAVMRVDRGFIVAHSDPITGAVELLGWLAVHVPCNDVAVTGARPRWLLVTLLLPDDMDEGGIARIAGDLGRAAESIGVAIVGGHTEYAPGIGRPIASSTAIGVGIGGSYVPTSGAKPGDHLVMTKFAGLEAAAILATDFRDLMLSKGVPARVLERAARLYERISVVREAVALAERGLVHSMHDPTEGGVVGGAAEMAYASGTTIELWEERIPIDPDMLQLFRAAGIDPLRSLSSGVLLAAVPGENVGEALQLLRSLGVEASVVGRVVERREGELVRLHRRDGRVEVVGDPFVEDELMRLWEEKS